MSRPKDLRIPPSELHGLREVFFARETHSGAQAAREMNVGQNTLWAWVHRHGMEPATAMRAAEVLEGWAIRLMERARALRRTATLAIENDAGRRMIAEPAQSVVRPRRRQNRDQTAPIPATHPRESVEVPVGAETP